MNNEEREPLGELMIRAMSMPKDTNPNGDIFGGWVLSQMDLAGAMLANQKANGKTVTIAVDAMKFILPVFVGDVLCCYAKVKSNGKTSIQIAIEAWARRQYSNERVLVTEGLFTFVAIDENRNPRPF